MKWNLKHLGRALLGGLIVWVVPFAVSLPLHDQSGNLVIDIFAFKTLMILVSSATGLFLLARQIPGFEPSFAKNGLILSLIWLGLNWALDFLVLIPLSGMSVSEYFLSTGLRYLNMPLSGFFIGLALDAREK